MILPRGILRSVTVVIPEQDIPVNDFIMTATAAIKLLLDVCVHLIRAEDPGITEIIRILLLDRVMGVQDGINVMHKIMRIVLYVVRQVAQHGVSVVAQVGLHELGDALGDDDGHENLLGFVPGAGGAWRGGCGLLDVSILAHLG